ncbi:MAG TPA: SDR family oxidoreductase [Pseudonocardiaceae bacterium]|jgi:NAD(P)-dependent dehydrogenase (short-subunit alcohol dehydrogenase family)|nr:SDR family oxidoreductase [Pseudonocardiaceae bacterium]
MPTRTWFITGATAGLGLELTRQLLRRGERVAATGRRLEQLTELADSHPDQLWPAALDVTDTAAIRRVVAEAVDRFGRLDVVVSNAGFGVLGAAEEISDELLNRQLAVNLIGPIQLARAVIPQLRAQGGGRIVQLSSTGGQVGDPGMSLYNASKFGIEGFYESAAVELAPFGIEVTLVEPGGARTDFNRNLVLAQPIPAYDEGIVGQLRGMLTAHPDLVRKAVTGDPAKIAAAVINSVDTNPAPRRLVLGGNAYQAITGALRERLAAVEAQRDLARQIDADDVTVG